MRLTGFAKYAWGMLALNLLVILLGAVVSSTGSGAGCGAHWPLCNGEVVPQDPRLETLIEYSHRLTSGLALLGVFGLGAWAFRAYPARHPVRAGAAAAVIFILIEALVGASLVLFGWVAFDQSLARVIMQPLHLSNTLLLLAALLFTAWPASGGAPLQLRGQGRPRWIFGLGLLGLMVISSAGALISLGDLLFPAASLAEGLRQDFDAAGNFLVRLRLWHPLLSVGVGAYLIGLVLWVPALSARPLARRFAWLTAGLVAAQWCAGLLNVLLLVPLWTQLLHLLLADLTWLVLLLWAASALASGDDSQPGPMH